MLLLFLLLLLTDAIGSCPVLANWCVNHQIGRPCLIFVDFELNGNAIRQNSRLVFKRFVRETLEMRHLRITQLYLRLVVWDSSEVNGITGKSSATVRPTLKLRRWLVVKAAEDKQIDHFTVMQVHQPFTAVSLWPQVSRSISIRQLPHIHVPTSPGRQILHINELNKTFFLDGKGSASFFTFPVAIPASSFWRNLMEAAGAVWTTQSGSLIKRGYGRERAPYVHNFKACESPRALIVSDLHQVFQEINRRWPLAGLAVQDQSWATQIRS